MSDLSCREDAAQFSELQCDVPTNLVVSITGQLSELRQDDLQNRLRGALACDLCSPPRPIQTAVAMFVADTLLPSVHTKQGADASSMVRRGKGEHGRGGTKKESHEPLDLGDLFIALQPRRQTSWFKDALPAEHSCWRR